MGIKDRLKAKIKKTIFTASAENTTQVEKKPAVERIQIEERDRNKVWAFCAGQASDDFRGNPKYLFIYINKYRKDITAYWLCQSEETMEQVRALGYQAYCEHTSEGQQAMVRTGVFVAEQVKNEVPSALKNAKYLNLYHGIGGKEVERYLTEGLLAKTLAKKYIKNNAYYRDRQLFLATSPITQDNFERMCGIDSDKIVKGGYPRCLYQKYFERIATFEHDIFAQKGLPADTKMAVYAPTFRKDSKDNVFITAFPNLDRLVEVCEKYHYMMVFKMHPIMENDPQYLLAKETYKECPYLYFWDNKDDFYEIIDKVDLGIVDYSSIFTDMLDAGVTHFLRYVYDFEEYEPNLTDPYDEITAGKRCMSFDELLEAMSDYAGTEVPEEVITPIQDRFWEYSGKDSLENIVNQTLEFQPVDRVRKNLYSFDIFDTLIGRKVLMPEGIFYYVKEKMKRSALDFPMHLIDHYIELRKNCEHNVREYYAKTMEERHDQRKEIQFDEIFDRMQELYELNDEQVEYLKKWELEAELDNVIPVTENVKKCLDLFHTGETVVLISDMYLPKEMIQKMLAKADPDLAKIPLYLSSERGWQKTTSMLYMEVYKEFGPNYDFGKWIHTGDNAFADHKMARAMGIITRNVVPPTFNEYESALVEKINTYDAYLIAAKMARFRLEHDQPYEQFAYEYVSMYMVPYIDWAIHEAVRRGDKSVYFVSRDGYHLKRIADVIIAKENLPLKTKYIYASRRTWRVPSFIDEIDGEFWGVFGNFAGINTFDKLLSALGMEEETFREMFPELRNLDAEEMITREHLQQIIEIFRQSERYHAYVLDTAKEGRVSVCGYLEQEIEKEEPFSIIEYWGRGYTQDCFVRLWNHIIGKEEDVPFYYARTILPTQGHSVRYNFTSNHTPQIFVEAIFANLDYKSIENYYLEDGIYKPEIVPIPCDQKLLKAMEEFLPVFTEDYCSIEYQDRASLRRELFDFSLEYYYKNSTNPIFLEIVAPLVDSVTLYGKKRQFAKPYTKEDLESFKEGVKRGDITRNIQMSVERSNEEVKEEYMKMYQLLPGDATNTGGLLTEKEIAENEKFQKEYADEKQFANQLAEKYEVYAEQEAVDQSVVICGKGNLEKNTSLRNIIRMLKNEDITLHLITFNRRRMSTDEMAKKMSRAKCIIITQNLSEIRELRLRPETQMIQLGDSAFKFFCQTKYKLKYRQMLTDLRRTNNITMMQVPSDTLIPTIKKYNGLNGNVDFSLKGCCQTDVYFDEKSKEQAKKMLIDFLPKAKGKKLIFYMPHHRMRSAKGNYLEFLDLSVLQEALGDEYFIFMKHPATFPKDVNNIMKVAGFAEEVNNKLLLRDCLNAADIIIGDYRDTIFEAPLTGKPVFITNRDYEYISSKETYFIYEDVIPGVPVSGEDDLIEKIRDIEHYDYTNANKFKEKYLTYCDGKSSKRLYEYVKKWLER